MKVYRIKHRPSGLFYNCFYENFDHEGSVLLYNMNISQGLLVYGSPIDKDPGCHIIPESELEVKEYELED